MKKNITLALVAGCLLSTTTFVSADQGDFSIGAKAGTLGVGLEAGIEVSEYLGIRTGINYLKFSFDTTISNYDYDFEPEFYNIPLLLDWHPFGDSFRLTAGAYINNNTVDVEGTYRKDLIPTEYQQYSDIVDLARIKGTAEFDTFAPYLGMGWTSNHAGYGWGVNVDLGVLFQGSAEVTELYIDDPWGAGNHPAVQPLIEIERQAIEDELEQFSYYPVASMSVSYKF